MDDQADDTLRPPANRVSPRARTMWRVAALPLPLLLLAGVIVWAVIDHDHRDWQAWTALAVTVLGLLRLVVMPEWRYRVHRWEADDVAVHSLEGWWSQERRVAPISRVQTVDTHYGPIERMFGLGTVTVTTASAAGAVRISGLERATVETLASRLTRITAATPGDAT